MKTREAARVVRDTTTKPGWKFTPWFVPGGKNLYVHVSYPSFESDRKFAPDFKQPTQLEVVYTLRVDDLTEDDEVRRRLLDIAVAIEAHEWQEMMRVPSRDYAAPFHPHTDAGKVAGIPDPPTRLGGMRRVRDRIRAMIATS